MTQYLTRRELREAERAGLTIEPKEVVAVPALDVTLEKSAVEPEQVVIQQVTPQAPQPQAEVFLSRRERRLAESNGLSPVVDKVESEPVSYVSEPATETASVVVPEVILAAMEEVALEAAAVEVKVSDDPAPEFTASNMLAEPNTQSIVLDVAPEAISLPLDTGEILSTGSIAILPDPTTGSLTGALDGLNVDDADRMDAVTGVITTVDPVSAMDVINQRVTVGVVPGEMLRKGWWQPWAYGALGLGLAVATIIATITIISALGE